MYFMKKVTVQIASFFLFTARGDCQMLVQSQDRPTGQGDIFLDMFLHIFQFLPAQSA